MLNTKIKHKELLSIYSDNFIDTPVFIKNIGLSQLLNVTSTYYCAE